MILTKKRRMSFLLIEAGSFWLKNWMDTLQRLIESGLYKKDTPLKLHLGCGMTHLSGYVNIDFPQAKHPVMTTAADAEADILYDLIFPNGSVDEIRLHHLFEHFSRVVALAQLVKWHGWLKVGGTLTIETPDLMGSSKQIASDGVPYTQKMAIVRHLAGDQSASWGFHLDQWWSERFENTLSKLGFHITKMDYSQWERWPHLCNVTVVAMKLGNIEVAAQIEQCLSLLEESMVSEREVTTFSVWRKQLLELLEGTNGK